MPLSPIHKKAIIATLLNARRPDLANSVAGVTDHLPAVSNVIKAATFGRRLVEQKKQILAIIEEIQLWAKKELDLKSPTGQKEKDLSLRAIHSLFDAVGYMSHLAEQGKNFKGSVQAKKGQDEPKGPIKNPWDQSTRADEGPTKPTKPTVPVKPSKPSEPVKPSKPTKKTEPTKPGAAKGDPFKPGEADAAEKSWQEVGRLQEKSGPGRGPVGKPKAPGAKDQHTAKPK